MKHIEVRVTTSALVPEGPVCANWGYRTTMPKELNYRCSMLDSWGTEPNDCRCRLFDMSLSREFGVGPGKCTQCLEACGE